MFKRSFPGRFIWLFGVSVFRDIVAAFKMWTFEGCRKRTDQSGIPARSRLELHGKRSARRPRRVSLRIQRIA